MKKWWIGLLTCLVAGQAQAASFDCAKASTKVEKLICADAGLSKLDEELAQAYRDGARRTAEPDRYKREQRTWLKQRESCLADETQAPACLKSKYTQRIQALSGKCWRHRKWDPAIASGGAGHLVSGKNWPMCRIVLENLNRFCHEDPKQMECGLRLDPGITSIKTPDWQPIDAKAHLGWIVDMIGVGTVDALMPYRWGDENPTFREQLANGQVQLWQANMDLSNDGIKERVVLMRYRNCVNGPPPMIVVIDEKTGKADPRFGFARGGYIPVVSAGKTYLLGRRLLAGSDAWELAEPFTSSRSGRLKPENWQFFDTTVCMFERVTN
jgi:uncharacterized protein YecT (DUF1311 family)